MHSYLCPDGVFHDVGFACKGSNTCCPYVLKPKTLSNPKTRSVHVPIQYIHFGLKSTPDMGTWTLRNIFGLWLLF